MGEAIIVRKGGTSNSSAPSVIREIITKNTVWTSPSIKDKQLWVMLFGGGGGYGTGAGTFTPAGYGRGGSSFATQVNGGDGVCILQYNM